MTRDKVSVLGVVAELSYVNVPPVCEIPLLSAFEFTVIVMIAPYSIHPLVHCADKVTIAWLYAQDIYNRSARIVAAFNRSCTAIEVRKSPFTVKSYTLRSSREKVVPPEIAFPVKITGVRCQK